MRISALLPEVYSTIGSMISIAEVGRLIGRITKRLLSSYRRLNAMTGGTRLLLNGALLIDVWTAQGLRTLTVSVVGQTVNLNARRSTPPDGSQLVAFDILSACAFSVGSIER